MFRISITENNHFMYELQAAWQKLSYTIIYEGYDFMKKAFCGMMILGVMICYGLAITEPVAENLSHGLLRFHIIGSSNSRYDQSIKCDVRDYISEKLSGYDNTELKSYVQTAEMLANERLEQLGTGYRARADIERVYIPKKSYKNITLPSGRYNAIRLKIGLAEGKNWWCVAYPSLCFSEGTAGELSAGGRKILADELGGDELELILDKPRVRFFVVDMMGKMREKLM